MPLRRSGTSGRRADVPIVTQRRHLDVETGSMATAMTRKEQSRQTLKSE